MKRIIFVLLVACFVTVSAYAESPFKFTISEDVSYDDNIYTTKDNTIASIISSTQLFAEYLKRIPYSGVKVGVNANVGYNAYSEKPSKNDYVNAGAGFKIGNRKFLLEEKFLYTADPATSELVDRVNRISNIATFRLKTSLEKMFSLGFVVSHFYDKYTDDDYSALNKNRINAGTQLYYNVSSRTSFYVGYLFSQISYEKTTIKDSLNNSIILGMNGAISQKIRGTAQVSYDMRSYEKELENAKRHAEIVGYLVSLTYEPTTKNSITLTGTRGMEGSTFANNRYYVSTEVGLEYKQQLCNRLAAKIFASYENMAYSEVVNDVERKDDLFKVRPSIEYKFLDSLFAGVWYQFRTKNSNYEGVEFLNNKCGVQIKFCF